MAPSGGSKSQLSISPVKVSCFLSDKVYCKGLARACEPHLNVNSVAIFDLLKLCAWRFRLVKSTP